MNKNRRQEALRIRVSAAELAAGRIHPHHVANSDEQRYRSARDSKGGSSKERSYIANFTKGLPHDDETGLLSNPLDYRQFIRGIQSGDPRDFMDTPLGPGKGESRAGCLSTPVVTCDKPADSNIWKSKFAKEKKVTKLRAWESQAAGLLFDLEGPDAQAVTMPPAPALESDEAAAEMAEVYLMALLRDVHVSQLRDEGLGDQHDHQPQPVLNVQEAGKILSQLEWFQKDRSSLNDRHRDLGSLGPQQLLQQIFRGVTPGDNIGPYLSQFLLIGNRGINPNDEPNELKSGYISYGSVRIDQRVRVAKRGRDYMTTFEEWLDVQHGADLKGLESYEPGYRFITTPRDLATYVHYDALYEAYLNACLILLGMGAPFDPGLPFQNPNVQDRQEGFASFGGPHILTLVTEVATRALKAVRFQKFNVHRRLRPEAFGGLIDRHKACPGVKELEPLKRVLEKLNKKDQSGKALLDLVAEHNAHQNSTKGTERSYLLPMAFPEGSPMHPSYGAGHAAVAGACVTILKAFFDHGWELVDKKGKAIAYEPDAHGEHLTQVELERRLTVEGELNKVASNIAIGRNWAGVHYFTDYIESLRLGEQIALGLLEEQKLTYGETFSMTVPLFDGGSREI